MTEPLAVEDTPDTDDIFDQLDDDFGHDLDDSGEEGSTQALFPGDEGGLSLIERRALIALLKNQFLTAADNPIEWRTIRENPTTFKSRLNDMFLDLHLDLNFEVAYKRQADSESGNKEFPTLLRDMAWGREDTILLIFLRQKYEAERLAGHDSVTVDRDDLVAQIATFRPAHATNRAADETRASNAVDNLIKAKVLARTNDSARLRVSPVLPVLLPVQRLQELEEWLLNANSTAAPADQTPETQEAE